MIEAITLATNSTVTVTTTISQQTTDVSYLGLPPTTITVISTVAMAIATIVLAIYAYLTVEEGKKARKLDSYEKQLVNLFNPMAWFLHRAEQYVQPLVVVASEGSHTPRYRKLLKTDVESLRKIFVEYGHYLESIERPYHRIESFLFLENQLDSRYLIFPEDQTTAEMCQLDKYANWGDIFAVVAVERQRLIGEWKKQLGYQIGKQENKEIRKISLLDILRIAAHEKK